MGILLVVVAILVAIAAFLNLSQATLGVGLMAFACFLAIFARMVQADNQHRELRQLLRPKT
jgi:hypothetical protein